MTLQCRHRDSLKRNDCRFPLLISQNESGMIQQDSQVEAPRIFRTVERIITDDQSLHLIDRLLSCEVDPGVVSPLSRSSADLFMTNMRSRGTRVRTNLHRQKRLAGCGPTAASSRIAALRFPQVCLRRTDSYIRDRFSAHY